jgi:hypothetical protein
MSEQSLSQSQLHSSIVAMISLASGIASKHPDMGWCQLDRLRGAGIPEHQIDAVIEIARHIRDEASQKLDAAFDEESTSTETATITVTEDETTDCCNSAVSITIEEESCGCTPTPGGQSCC